MRLWVNTIAVHSFFTIVWVLWYYLIPWSLLWSLLFVWVGVTTQLYRSFEGLNNLVGRVYYLTIYLFYPNQAGRLLLRRVVCEKIGVPWSEIRLERSPRGKPYLASPIKVPIHSRYHGILQSLLLYLNYIALYYYIDCTTSVFHQLYITVTLL